MAATQDIVTLFEEVTTYGEQLAASLQKAVVVCNPIPIKHESLKNIHGTIAALSELSSLVKDHVEKRKEVFSQRGLEFAHELAKGSGKTFVSIVDIVVNICLSHAERKALRKKRKEEGSAEPSFTDVLSAGLDEDAFLKTLDKGIQWWASYNMEKCISRLHQIHLHLHLLNQVATVGLLSKDLSSGNIDMQNMLAYHKRIKRTAGLVGIEPRRGRHQRIYPGDSDTESDISDSGSSDRSLSPPRPPPGRIPNPNSSPPGHTTFQGPPPPRPTSVVQPLFPGPPPPVNMPGPPSLPQLNNRRIPVPPVDFPGPTGSNSRPTLLYGRPPPPPPPPPPAGPPFPRPGLHCPYPGTALGPGPGPGPGPISLPMPSISPPAYVARSSKEPSEKESVKDEEQAQINAPVKPPAHEARLFKAKSKGLGFRLKRTFRSKESLADEMRQTLVDTETRLIAYVIQPDDFWEIPHSAFHSLEATHMKTILSQLHNSEWYKTFVGLNAEEHRYLDRILRPISHFQAQDRELVVLKVLREEKYAAELRLVNWIPRIQLYPNGADDRRLLAIVREKLVDGKPMTSKDSPRRLHPPPPPPPPPPMSGPLVADFNTRQSLTSFAEYVIRFRDHHANGPRPLTPIIERLYNDQAIVRQHVRTFERRGGDVIGATLLLTERQREHLNHLMQEIRANEHDSRFEWNSVELSLHNEQGEICDFYPKGGINMAQTAIIIHLIVRRTLLPYVNSESVRHLIGCGPPRGYLGPQTGPPFCPAPAPVVVPVPPQRGPVVPHTGPVLPTTVDGARVMVNRVPRRASSISSLGSDATCDLSFQAQVKRARKRRELRRQRAVRAERADADWTSDSFTDSDSDDDSFFLDISLEVGDDVVEKLVEVLTPAASKKGSASS